MFFESVILADQSSLSSSSSFSSSYYHYYSSYFRHCPKSFFSRSFAFTPSLSFSVSPTLCLSVCLSLSLSPSLSSSYSLSTSSFQFLPPPNPLQFLFVRFSIVLFILLLYFLLYLFFSSYLLSSVHCSVYLVYPFVLFLAGAETQRNSGGWSLPKFYVERWTCIYSQTFHIFS